VIVGGSYAAYQMAASARENGHDRSIVVITDEGELPYHRLPLSKAFLQAGPLRQELPLKSESFYRGQQQVGFSRGEPRGSGCPLTLRTMPISAGIISGRRHAAGVAGIDLVVERLGSHATIALITRRSTRPR